MEELNVKFGTPRSILFREYDAEHPGIDLTMEVRIAGSTDVLDYDRALYGNDEDVKTRIRQNALMLLQNCLTEWPGPKSVMRSDTLRVIAETLDKGFAAMGITAKTEIFNFSLTKESEELYKALRQQEMVRMQQPFGWDHINFGYDHGIDEHLKPDCVPPMGFDPKQDLLPGGIEAKKKREEASQNRPDDRYCRRCGEKRPESAKYCPGCGAKFG